MDLDRWNIRATARAFDKSNLPKEEAIQELCTLIEYIPAQLGAVDHIWCLLTPDDAELKKWLVHNCYYTYDEKHNHKEYFTALIDAPYVLHSFALNGPIELAVRENERVRNNAFHAGVLVCEAVNKGYDVAQICCIDGFEISQVEEVYRQKIWDRFSDSFSKVRHTFNEKEYIGNIDFIKKPTISIGIGTKIPFTEESFTPYHDGVTFSGAKQKKWFNNFIK